MEEKPEKFRVIIAELQSMVEVDQAMRNRCTDNVDKRRKEMELETLSENQKRMQKMYGRKSA